MIEPKRYDVTESYGLGDMREEEYGNYVHYDDYARIKAKLDNVIKAGNAMAEVCGWDFFNTEPADRLVADWLAAKEGNPQP